MGIHDRRVAYQPRDVVVDPGTLVLPFGLDEVVSRVVDIDLWSSELVPMSA